MNNNTNINNKQNITNNQIQPQINTKQQLRKFFVFLIILGIILSLIATFLLINDNKKYNTYTITAADLIRTEKVYKNEIPYYKGIYKYKIKHKEYFYNSQKLTSQTPEQLIQVKYNPTNPNDIYNEDASKYFFIILFSGLGLSFISIIVVVSLSSTKQEKIITVQVVNQVTCVGGRRIYLSDISIPDTSKEATTSKYYVYFSNDLKKFNIGNKLNFNIYKYNEVFTTEPYNNVIARAIYNFKDEDFTVVEQPPQPTINKY